MKLKAWVKAVLFLLVMSSVVILSMDGEPEVEWVPVVATEGDSLYSLVSQANGMGTDVGELMHMVKKENGVDTVIYPGQKLVVPVVK